MSRERRRGERARDGLPELLHGSKHPPCMHAGSGATASRKSPAGPPPASSSRSTSAPHERPQPARDIVAKNKLAAGTPGRPPRPTKEDEGAKYRQKKDLGQVPDYLLRRKVENIEKAEAEARAKEAALIPPGLRLVPEEERMETLRILQANKAELERAIWALPLKIETLGQRKRKEALDERMQEIEQGLQIFSRPKVLVRA